MSRDKFYEDHIFEVVNDTRTITLDRNVVIPGNLTVNGEITASYEDLEVNNTLEVGGTAQFGSTVDIASIASATSFLFKQNQYIQKIINVNNLRAIIDSSGSTFSSNAYFGNGNSHFSNVPDYEVMYFSSSAPREITIPFTPPSYNIELDSVVLVLKPSVSGTDGTVTVEFGSMSLEGDSTSFSTVSDAQVVPAGGSRAKYSFDINTFCSYENLAYIKISDDANLDKLGLYQIRLTYKAAYISTLLGT